MKVVSNTSPICYLILIDSIERLTDLFGEIQIPLAVRRELSDPAAPQAVRRWIVQPPSWLRVHDESLAVDPDLNRLHPGEREAILLAQRLKAGLILLDDKAARIAAEKRGLKVAGLLGVLAEAASRGLLDPVDAIERLQNTNFRATPSLLRSVLKRMVDQTPDFGED